MIKELGPIFRRFNGADWQVDPPQSPSVFPQYAMCASGLARFFDIPADVRTIFLMVSDRYVPGAVRAHHNPRYKSTRIQGYKRGITIQPWLDSHLPDGDYWCWVEYKA